MQESASRRRRGRANALFRHRSTRLFLGTLKLYNLGVPRQDRVDNCTFDGMVLVANPDEFRVPGRPAPAGAYTVGVPAAVPVAAVVAVAVMAAAVADMALVVPARAAEVLSGSRSAISDMAASAVMTGAHVMAAALMTAMRARICCQRHRERCDQR